MILFILFYYFIQGYCNCVLDIGEYGRLSRYAIEDTFSIADSDLDSFVFMIRSCEGDLCMKHYAKEGWLKAEGCYVSPDNYEIDSNKAYSIEGEFLGYHQFKLYKPRKTGTWLYYNKDNEVSRVENF